MGPPELVLSDSMLPPVFAGSQEDTLLPCSPSQLPHTNVAQETLRSVDHHDAIVQKEAGKQYSGKLHVYTDLEKIFIIQNHWLL